jgi:hypothetical protein
MQNGVQIAVVSIHTSCSQPLFIGNIYSDSTNLVKLTVESGTDTEGKQSIFLEHDPICEGVTLTVTKILDPPEDPGKFILQIDGVDKSGPVGDGQTTGPVLLMPGIHSVSEIAASGTILDDYTRTIGGDCNPDGSIELAKGDNAECVITNIKIKPATITLKKVITEDNTDESEEVGADAFHFSIRNTQTNELIPITTDNQSVSPGEYTLIEEGPDNFDFVMITGDNGCPTVLEGMDLNLDKFTLSSEENLTCVVYNEDDADAIPGGEPDGPGVIFHFDTVQFEISEEPSSYGRDCRATSYAPPCVVETSEKAFTVRPDLSNASQEFTKSTLVMFSVIPEDLSNASGCTFLGLSFNSTLNKIDGFKIECTSTGLNNQYNVNYALIETMSN